MGPLISIKIYRQKAKEIIETAYDTLKSKLQLENFSGKTEISVRQDFFATIYLIGVAEICAAEASRAIENADRGKTLKHPRKANLTIAKLRRNL